MSTLSVVLPMAAADLAQPVASGWRLIVAALLGIAVIVVLITALKVHPSWRWSSVPSPSASSPANVPPTRTASASARRSPPASARPQPAWAS